MESIVLELGGSCHAAWPAAARATVTPEMVRWVQTSEPYAWRGLDRAVEDLRGAAFLISTDRMRDVAICAADNVRPDVTVSDGPDGGPWTATLNPVLRAMRDADLGAFLRSCWPLDGSAEHAPVQRARTLSAAETSTVRVREAVLSEVCVGDWPRVAALGEAGVRLVLRGCFDVPTYALPAGTELKGCHVAGERNRSRTCSGITTGRSVARADFG